MHVNRNSTFDVRNGVKNEFSKNKITLLRTAAEIAALIKKLPGYQVKILNGLHIRETE